jgi:uncharacterized protein
MLHALARGLAVIACFSASSFAAVAAIDGKYVKTPTGYLMVLKPGDDVSAHLSELAEREKILGGSVSGIGFLEEVKFAYFDVQTKEYISKTYNDVELTNLTGSLAWKEGKPSLHIHGTVAGRDYQAFGGHILDSRVGRGTLELYVTVFDKALDRIFDTEINANTLKIK